MQKNTLISAIARDFAPDFIMIKHFYRKIRVKQVIFALGKNFIIAEKSIQLAGLFIDKITPYDMIFLRGRDRCARFPAIFIRYSTIFIGLIFLKREHYRCKTN